MRVEVRPIGVVISGMDHAIDAAPLVERGLGHGVAIFGFGDIAFDGNGLSTLGLDVGDNRFNRVHRAGGHNNLCAFCGGTAAHGLPHAGASACDDDDFVLQDHDALLCSYWSQIL